MSASSNSAASILVVDDTPANLGVLIETLSQAGYTRPRRNRRRERVGAGRNTLRPAWC